MRKVFLFTLVLLTTLFITSSFLACKKKSEETPSSLVGTTWISLFLPVGQSTLVFGEQNVVYTPLLASSSVTYKYDYSDAKGSFFNLTTSEKEYTFTVSGNSLSLSPKGSTQDPIVFERQ